jgi:hypothetical protein
MLLGIMNLLTFVEEHLVTLAQNQTLDKFLNNELFNKIITGINYDDDSQNYTI